MLPDRSEDPADRQHSSHSSIAMNKQEEKLLRLDLADVAVPKVHGMDVEGFQPSWFDRLFGRR